MNPPPSPPLPSPPPTKKKKTPTPQNPSRKHNRQNKPQHESPFPPASIDPSPVLIFHDSIYTYIHPTNTTIFPPSVHSFHSIPVRKAWTLYKTRVLCNSEPPPRLSSDPRKEDTYPRNDCSGTPTLHTTHLQYQIAK